MPATHLFEHEVYQLVSKEGMNVPEWFFAKKGEFPKPAAGKKYVAKIVAENLFHKTDLGGLAFNVTSENIEHVHLDMMKKFPNGEGVLYVEQIEYSKTAELILGAHYDQFFGHLVTIGFGGTGTEFFNNVMKKGNAKATFSFNLSEKETEKIVSGLPVVKMITGEVRGFKKEIELKEVLRAVFAFQKIIAKEISGKSIAEIEINPLVVSKGKLVALDGVLRLMDKPKSFPKKPIRKIGNLLDPKSACIVGASGKNPYSPANIILKNLLSAGIAKDEIYLIHPKEEEIEGIKCFPSLSDVVSKRNGKPVDLLIVGVQAKIAASILEESFKVHAAEAIQIISAGFGETAAGKELQKDLERKLSELDHDLVKRPVINGPNTLGNIFMGKKTLFTSPKKNSGTGRGRKNVGLICQSGAFMITTISDLANMVSPLANVSVGNQMDISVVDCLEYLLENKDITTYGLYIEGLKDGDGKHLVSLAKKASDAGKFVIVYKAGRTKEGADATKGHTASMAGDYSLFESIVSSSGAIVADTFAEFQNLLMLTSCMKPLHKKDFYGVVALSNAGFEKCAIADYLMRSEKKNFSFSKFSPETIEKLKKIYEDHGISGIMDIHDVLDLTPMMNDEGFDKVVRTILGDKNVDLCLCSIVPETQMLKIKEAGSEKPEAEDGLLNRLIKIYSETSKPLAVSIDSGWKYDEFAFKCIDAGIPCFRRSDAASRALDKLLRSKL